MKKATALEPRNLSTVTTRDGTSNGPASLALHVILTFFLIELTFFLGCGVLILLILGNEIIHVALSLGEFHLVHSFACVPVQECLAAEHGCEELCNALEHFLNCCGVAQEGNCHLQALWWDTH